MTCLVVDDSATMRRICRRALETAGCEAVLEAGTRAEAESQATDTLDLVITGRHLPDGDVLEFVRGLRAATVSAQVPVLMISDRGQRSAVSAACEAGVTSYLLRPFTLPALQQRIEALLKHETPVGEAGDADRGAEAAPGEESQEPEARAA